MKKRLLSLLLAVSLMAGMLSTTAYADTMPFTDLDDGAWYMSAVQYAYDNGLMNGMTATTFAPNTPLSRAMFVTILGRMAGINEDDYTGSTGFTDAPAGDWYAPYVKWAAESGIVNGMTPTTFAPDANITREQMAAILVRYVENNDLYLPASSKAIASFADKASISEWAEELVDQARSWGIFAGNAAGNFTPQSSATRAEAATVFMRLEEYLYLSSPEADSLVVADEEHIATDAETGIRFVDNTVLAYTQNYLTDEEKQSIADLVNGEIVGQLSGALDMLQIQVEVSTLTDLEAMADILKTSDSVYYAAYDILVDVEDNTSTSTSTTDGDWWRDAINLDDAWEKYGELYEDDAIRVGVIDRNIDLTNNLVRSRFQVLSGSSLPAGGTDHGTTVSYLLAGSGGVVDTGVVNGYFASWKKNSGVSLSKVSDNLDGLAECGCTVINNSYGLSSYFDPDNMDDDEFWDDIEYFAAGIASVSCSIILKNDKIMFVQAAGNDGISSRLNGFWSSISYSTEISEICSRTGVSYQELKNHILIVSAVENTVSDKTYSVPSWTNYDNIDICAPGADIRESSGTIGSGTSYAAPIVSGVVALVWAAAPDLTAAQVKEILTTATEYQGVRSEGTGRGTYPMVNALTATDAALQTLYEGTVINSVTNEPIEDATIHFYDENDVELESTYYTEDDELLTTCVSDETGEFIAYVNRMAIDHLTVEKDGYIIAELDIDEEMTKYNYSATALEEEEERTPYQLGNIPLFDLSLYAEELEKYVGESGYTFGLLYIDKDNDPEMVIMMGTGFHLSVSNFYFVQSDGLCMVQNSTQYGSFVYASKANRIWFSAWSNGYGSTDTITTWTGEEFKTLKTLSNWSFGVSNGYNITNAYEVDGLGVTKSVYQDTLATIQNSQNWITCTAGSATFAITTANIEDMLENPESYIIG